MQECDEQREAIYARVEHWAQRLRVRPRQVRVQRMTRKWGSCSTSGIVTLAADLVDQEAGFQDFVIAHELLHLRIPSHAKLFKALMTMHVPDWKKYAMRKQSVAYGSNIAPEGDAGRTREKLCRPSSTTKKTAWPLCH